MNWTLLSSVEDRGSKCLKRGREPSPTMSLAFFFYSSSFFLFLLPISLLVDVCVVPVILQALIATSEILFSEWQFKWPHQAGRQKVKTLSTRLLTQYILFSDWHRGCGAVAEDRVVVNQRVRLFEIHILFSGEYQSFRFCHIDYKLAGVAPGSHRAL